jgi:hypothetical protein
MQVMFSVDHSVVLMTIYNLLTGLNMSLLQVVLSTWIFWFDLCLRKFIQKVSDLCIKHLF